MRSVGEDTYTECFSIASEQRDCCWSHVLTAGNTKPAVIIKLKVFCSRYALIWLSIHVSQNAWTFYIFRLAGKSLSRHHVFHLVQYSHAKYQSLQNMTLRCGLGKQCSPGYTAWHARESNTGSRVPQNSLKNRLLAMSKRFQKGLLLHIAKL